MINRRDYLTVVGIGIALPLSGCVREIKAIAESTSDTNRTIGDTATYEGVEVTPTKYVLSPSVKQIYAHAENEQQAPSGATFLLTHLKVEHKGDSAQKLPYTQYQDNVDLYYGDEQVYDGPRSEISNEYVINGKRLTSYHQAIADADARGKVYPGTTVEGWLFHEVAQNFSPENLELRITWNQQMLDDEGETVHRWAYTDTAEAPISDIEGDGDDSISM